MSTAFQPFTLMQLLLKFLEFRSLRMAITYMCICNQEVSDSLDLSQPLHTKVISHFLRECSVLIFNLLFHQSQIQSSWSKEKPAKKTLILHQKTKSMRWKPSLDEHIKKKMTISKLRWWKIVSVSGLVHLRCLGVPHRVDPYERPKSFKRSHPPPKHSLTKKKNNHYLSRTKHRKKTTTNFKKRGGALYVVLLSCFVEWRFFLHHKNVRLKKMGTQWISAIAGGKNSLLHMTNPVMKQDKWWSISCFIDFWTHQKNETVLFLAEICQVEFTVKRVPLRTTQTFLKPTHDVIILSCQKIFVIFAQVLRFLFGHSARTEHTEEQFQQEHLLWQAQLSSGNRSHGHIKSESHAHRHSPGHWSSEP